MEPHFQHIIDTVEPLEDPVYGPLYRCSLTLKDGTHLPCAMLQSRHRIVELAKQRIFEECSDEGKLAGEDPLGQIVAAFLTGGNHVNDYDVVDAQPSPFAPPLSLLRQIEGETKMAWTGWVFEMRDRSLFPYGSSFLMEFFQLPEGYSFADVAKVHNHSYVTGSGELRPLEQGAMPPDPEDYDRRGIFRERPHFVCAIEGI